MILWLYKLFTSLNMHIHLHYYYFFFFTKTVKLFLEIRPTVGKRCPIYILLWLHKKKKKKKKKKGWIYIGCTGFTLFRRFRRFRRAELPDEYSMQCTPPNYLLRHKCLRKKFHLEWHLWHPFILKVTSQSEAMPDSTVLRAARTSSENNLKIISEVGNNPTYPGSFVSPSNTYVQSLKKVPFELQKKKKKKKKKNPKES